MGKRISTLVLLMVLSSASVFALNYQFSMNFSVLPEFSIVKNDPVPVRSSLALTTDLSFVSLRIDKQNIVSIPFSFSWTTPSSSNSYFPLHSHFDIGVGLGYQYNVNRSFSVRAIAQGGVRVYEKILGWTPIYFMGGFDFFYCPMNNLAINFPIRIKAINKECDVSIGIGMTFYYDILTARQKDMVAESDRTLLEIGNEAVTE